MEKQFKASMRCLKRQRDHPQQLSSDEGRFWKENKTLAITHLEIQGGKTRKMRKTAAKMFWTACSKTRSRKACSGCYHIVPLTSCKVLGILTVILPIFNKKTFLLHENIAFASTIHQKDRIWLKSKKKNQKPTQSLGPIFIQKWPLVLQDHKEAIGTPAILHSQLIENENYTF